MLKLNRRLAWLTIGAWAVVGAGAAVKAGDAAARLTGQGGTSVHAEAQVAGKVLERAFARPLGDVFAVTVESPEPVTACSSRRRARQPGRGAQASGRRTRRRDAVGRYGDHPRPAR